MNAPMKAPPHSPARRPPFLTFALLAALLHTVSCGDDTDSASSDTLETWSLSADPTVVIGGADEREGYLLHQVVGATRLADGRIVVANHGTLQLRYYDPEGTHLFDAGGEGEGPGEFESLAGFTRLPGDSILVDSWRRLSRFGPDGRYASSIPYDMLLHEECRWTTGGGQHPLADGSMVVVSVVYAGIIGGRRCPIPAEAQPPAVIGRFIPATGVFDTIAELPGTEESYRDNTYAYPKTVAFAIGNDRVYLGQTGSDTILAISFTGDTVATLLSPFDPVPVPADARKTGSTRGTLIFPDHYPRYARLVAAPADRVWVMAYPPLKEPIQYWELVIPTASLRLDEGARWSVVGRNGRAVAELQTPPGFFLLEVGDDYILGLHKDELERESVQVYQLTR